MSYKEQFQQLTLDYVCEKGEEKHVPTKRIDIVSVRMVKECSLMYKDRVVGSSQDGANLMRQFLGDVDREHFLVICLDTKNQPTAINVAHIGSLNASILYPREVMKPAILSNAAGVIVDHNHPSGNPLTIV